MVDSMVTWGTQMRRNVWMGVTACVLSLSAVRADDLPTNVSVTTPDAIKWQRSESGRDVAYILGRPDQPGPYLYLVKWPPNSKERAHMHPDSRYGTVLSGKHYIGYGDHFDETKLLADVPGTMFTEPARTAHFGMTKDEGAVLYFYGTGPSAIIPVEKAESAK
jgi:hypothetical protein